MARIDSAHELALIAQEIGAEVIRGPVRYPGREGVEGQERDDGWYHA
jgi:hypothetical protein